MSAGSDLSTVMAMQVLRKVAAENASALVPHYATLIPSIVSLLQQTQGPQSSLAIAPWAASSR